MLTTSFGPDLGALPSRFFSGALRFSWDPRGLSPVDSDFCLPGIGVSSKWGVGRLLPGRVLSLLGFQ